VEFGKVFKEHTKAVEPGSIDDDGEHTDDVKAQPSAARGHVIERQRLVVVGECYGRILHLFGISEHGVHLKFVRTTLNPKFVLHGIAADSFAFDEGGHANVGHALVFGAHFFYRLHFNTEVVDRVDGTRIFDQHQLEWGITDCKVGVPRANLCWCYTK